MRLLAPSLRPFRFLTALLCLGSFAAGHGQLKADDFYWGSDTTGGETADFASWQDTTHWFDDAAGTIAAGAAPGASDHAIFSISSLNGTALVPRLFANTTVNQISFYNTQSLTITGSSNRSLHIGSGGIYMDDTNVTLGSSTANRNILVRVLESQTWTNAGSGTLNVRNNAAASDLAAGDVVLTLNAASTGTITNSGAYSDGAAGSLGLIIDSEGSGQVNVGNSSYSGGTEVRRGSLTTTGNGATNFIGSGVVLLGHTSGTGNATIRVNTLHFGNDVTVQDGNSGELSVDVVRSNDSELAGNYTLEKDLTILTRTNLITSLSGVVSGDGGLIKGQSSIAGGGNGGTLSLTDVNTYAGNTTVSAGILSLEDNAGLTFYIGANGINNSIGGSATLNLHGDFIFDLSQASLIDGNIWNIVNVGTLNETYGETFAVQGFTESEAGVWTQGGFTFTESDGNLTFVPEGSTAALVLGALGLFCLVRRRRVA